MGRGIGKIQKKRFFSVSLFFYVLHASFGRFRNVLIGIPITAHRAGPALPATFFNGLPFRRIHDGIGCLYNLIIFNPTIRRKVNDGVTEVIIKSMSQRAVWNSLAPVKCFRAIERARLLVFLCTALCPDNSIVSQNGIPIPTEMPFANCSGRVTLCLKHFRKRYSFCIEC